MKKIALVINFDKRNALSVANELVNLLRGKAEIYCDLREKVNIEGVIYKNEDELFSLCPVVVVLGGDGTIISTAKKCVAYKNILVGINIGNLGYLSAIESNNLTGAAQLLLSDDIHYDNRYMLCVKVYSNGKEISCHHALNEIVITRPAKSRLMDFTAYSNEKTVCHYRADGMIVSTPTGSTAYSLSAGGPVLSPDADAILLTPICPHMLRARSIIFPPKLIKINPSSEAELSVDGQIFETVGENDFITVEKSEYVTRLAHNKELSFYDILQKKL